MADMNVDQIDQAVKNAGLHGIMLFASAYGWQALVSGPAGWQFAPYAETPMQSLATVLLALMNHPRSMLQEIGENELERDLPKKTGGLVP
jgi:hypothetical protein